MIASHQLPPIPPNPAITHADGESGGDLVPAEAIAKLLGVKPTTVRTMFRSKRIPGFRFSKKVLLFRVEEVLKAVRQERQV